MLTVCKYIKILKFYLLDLKKMIKKVKHHLYGFQLHQKLIFQLANGLNSTKKII